MDVLTFSGKALQLLLELSQLFKKSCIIYLCYDILLSSAELFHNSCILGYPDYAANAEQSVKKILTHVSSSNLLSISVLLIYGFHRERNKLK